MTGPILPGEKKGVGVLDVDDYYWLPPSFFYFISSGWGRLVRRKHTDVIGPSRLQFLLKVYTPGVSFGSSCVALY